MPGPTDPNDPNATNADPTKTAAGDQSGGVDEDAIAQLVSKTVNAAVSSHMKRMKLDDTVSAMVKKQLESLAKPSGETQPSKGAGDQPKADPLPQPKTGAETSPEVEELRKKLKSLEKANEESKREKLQMKRKAEKNEARSAVRAALEKSGVRPEMLDTVVDRLTAKGSTGRILRRNEEGEFELRVKRVRGKDESPEELAYTDIHAGIRDWMKGEDAKPFIPAPGKKTNPTAIAGQRGPSVAWTPGPQVHSVGRDGKVDDPIGRTIAQLSEAGVDLGILYNND